MRTNYHLTELHLFRMLEKNILFNVETMLFYEVTPLVCELITLLSKDSQSNPLKFLKNQYPKKAIQQTLLYLKNEGLLKEVISPRAAKQATKSPLTKGVKGVVKNLLKKEVFTEQYYNNGKKPILKKRYGIRHLELMVTHGCNMGCRYCYGADTREEWKDAAYLYGAKTIGMSFNIAKRGVDFLIENSGNQKELSVIFFGGEPLLEFGLIERIVPYVRERELASGKNIDISLSTNGTLLTDSVVDFLVKYRVGCQVSIDGPREIQDKNRSLRTGGGSYDHVLAGVKRLVAARRGNVPARATISHDLVNLLEVVDHLFSIGFGSVHIEPTIGKSAGAAITREDVERIKKQHESLAMLLIKSVRNNRYFNYSNLVRYVRQTRVVRERLAYYCGAGRTYFALSQDGVFYPCHRFVGMKDYAMGDLEHGLDQKFQQKILDLTVHNRPVCKDCWARYLCGGGCWKHAVDINGCLEIPDNEMSCEIIRHEIECAMAINTELKVSDKDILSEMYEKGAEPYLVEEK